ncbi:MAG: Lrp/AsnC family transcriptional regulator [Deltaproteobacteria bacterium]|nr:MAG: Lrp/AsnC family transcriptional regulator [Deltaproteobacteria bacterium]UCG65725.1 MAG: Lrp/AsnC family transcriptional regulator [Deltaproteobacteria bacterium]
MKRSRSNTRIKKIDKTDCDIIKMLQKDGRLSNTTIAKKLGVSEATVRARLNRLINEEYIQIVAVGNPIKLGFDIVGMIRFEIDLSKVDSIIRELKKLKPIWFIVQTTGNIDIHAEFNIRSLYELKELITKKINKIDGIIRTDTALILDYAKRDYAWGTALA